MEMQGRGSEGQEDQLNRQQVKLPETQMTRHQPPPLQRCPRCDSVNTKFCYYNNYSLSQPRYFCKGCRRYWTHGGTLRNVPVGGGCRKSKRSKASSSSSTGGETARTQPLVIPTLPPQNLINVAGGISGNSGILPGGSAGSHSLRALPTLGSFYSGGEFLSTLAAMQPRINQVPVNLGGGTTHFGGGANMVQLFQGLNLPQGQIQAQNESFSSQQHMVPARPLYSWTQNYLNTTSAAAATATTDSVSNPNFWNNATGVGGTSSINPNQWPADNLDPSYNPSG